MKKIRICLICDRPFDSVFNRICGDCHKKHEALFRSYGFEGNWAECLYSVVPEEGDVRNVESITPLPEEGQED